MAVGVASQTCLYLSSRYYETEIPMKSIKSTVKRLVPRLLLAAYSRERLRWDMTKSRGKSREEIFSDIYENNRWGGKPGNYFSGIGSLPDASNSYISVLRALIRSEKVKHIVDLGCGDFEVARRILSPELSYVGCDIVPGVAARNTARFANERIEFRNLDMVTDPLPEGGDLCIVRQVFQHLSNGDIATVLRKARKYPLLVVTDEQVVGDRSGDNIDITPYHGTRRLFGQGLKLEAGPFFERVQVLLKDSGGSDYPVSGSGTYLRTVLIRNDGNRSDGLS
jgi:SAM-dependent methyltransferase